MQSAKKMVGYTHNVGIISDCHYTAKTKILQYFSDFNMSIILLITEIQNSIQ